MAIKTSAQRKPSGPKSRYRPKVNTRRISVALTQVALDKIDNRKGDWSTMSVSDCVETMIRASL